MSERNVLLPPVRKTKIRREDSRGTEVPDEEEQKVVGIEGKNILHGAEEQGKPSANRGKTLPCFCLFLVQDAPGFSESVGVPLSSGEIHKTENVPQQFNHVD